MKEIDIDFNVEDILGLGNLILDEHMGIYGFTVTLINGTIRNVYLKGNTTDLMEEIEKLKREYLKIKNKINS